MGLKIIVCVKAVVDGPRDNAGKKITLNLFDRPAIAMANALIRTQGGSLTLLSMGPEGARPALYEGLSMGADTAVLACDPLFRESDTYVTAGVLAAAVRKISEFDLIFFGTRSSDSDTGHVGPQTAQMLKLPFVSHVHALDADPDGTTVTRCADGFLEKFLLNGPAAVSVVSQGGDYEYTALHEIENTFENKTIQCWNHGDLLLSPHEIGRDASPTRMVAVNPQKQKKQCRFIDGDVEKAAQTLATTLSQAGLVD